MFPSRRERAVRELFHARQSDRACASWRCGAPRSASTSRWSTTCARMRSRAPGRRASACWCRVNAGPVLRRWCAMRRARRPAARVVDGDLCRDLAAQRLSETERDRIAEALRLAERLGGEAVTVPASAVADGVIDYAQANNFTHIVVAPSRRPRWSEFLRRSAAHELIRRAGDISVHVMPEEQAEGAGQGQNSGRRVARRRARCASRSSAASAWSRSRSRSASCCSNRWPCRTSRWCF